MLQREGVVSSRRWHREFGRPVTVYARKDGALSWDDSHHCGQCAFYVSPQRHCRLWSLLGKAFGIKDARWQGDGRHPLSAFELYKMRNAWRISPYSPACKKFIDKKRDYSLERMPEDCDICARPMPAVEAPLVVCPSCRTRYSRGKKRVRVLTAYENKFSEVYAELAGHEPSVDLTRLREEHSRVASGFGALEEQALENHRFVGGEGGGPQPTVLILFPGDTMIRKGDRLFFLGLRRVEAVPIAETTIVDHGVLGREQMAELEQAGAIIRSVATPHADGRVGEVKYELGPLAESSRTSHPEVARTFAVAMAESAIHGTKGIARIAKFDAGFVRPLTDAQVRIVKRIGQAPVNKLLTHEAHVMKHYWALYDLTLKTHSQHFGPRTRARFVRERVMSPTGRAKGYTAVDSAINYLHHRRLYKIKETNSRLGISAYGEGFLHCRRRRDAKGLGLLLDLSDPPKFADREKLLEAVLDFRVNWRDFRTGTDRQGVTFYYPKSEIIPMLEKLSDDADGMTVEYDGVRLKLSEAYERSVSGLASYLAGEGGSFAPFVF